MSKAKIEKHIVGAQKQQLKIKEKNLKYVPGTLNLQILGSGAPGAPSSVYLFTDQSRFVFEHKIDLLSKWIAIDFILLTDIYLIVAKALND